MSLERVSASPDGARLLALIADPHAEKRRRRQDALDALGDRMWLGGDALVDVWAGRVPRVWTLVSDDPVALALELRRRLRGNVSSRRLQGAVHLEHEDGLKLRVLDLEGRGPLAEPVVALRGARLVLDGPRAGALLGEGVADLLAGRLRLTDPAALERRPEAVVTVARLAVRPELACDVETTDLLRAALAADALGQARQSRLWFALPDLLAAPEAVAALELLRDLRAPAPLHESAEVDGALLRRVEALLGARGSRSVALTLAVARTATRHRVRSFAGWTDFGGVEARAVIAAAGPERRPRWALSP
jgi:hypothetical protein